MNIKTAICRAAGSVIKSVRKNKSAVISIGAMIGVGATAVLAVKGVEDLKEEAIEGNWDEMDSVEKAVCVVKHVGPAVVSGIVTCVAIGVNERNHKQVEASLITACVGSGEMLKRFKGKTEDIYGPEAVKDIEHGISEDFATFIPATQVIHMPKGSSDEKILFYVDDGSRNGYWFYDTIAHVKDCGASINRKLALMGFAELADLIDLYTDGDNADGCGQGLGWSLMMEEGWKHIDIAYDLVLSEEDNDTPPFYRIIFLTPPSADFLG